MNQINNNNDDDDSTKRTCTLGKYHSLNSPFWLLNWFDAVCVNASCHSEFKCIPTDVKIIYKNTTKG